MPAADVGAPTLTEGLHRKGLELAPHELLLLRTAEHAGTISGALRNIAEHAVISDPADPMRHSRTTLAFPLVRFFVAPHNANFHLEHHIYQYIPQYRLPAAHRLFLASGALEGAEVTRGYLGVWRKAWSGGDRDHDDSPRSFVNL